MDRTGWFAVAFGVATLACWGPDVGLHALAGQRFSGGEVALLILLLPALVWAGFRLLSRLGRGRVEPAVVAAGMLAGIWVPGPPALLLGDPAGGAPRPDPLAVLFLSNCPPIKLALSTYDGTLLPLAVVTLLLPVLGSWPQPPGLPSGGSPGAATPDSRV